MMGSSSWAGALWENILFSSILKIGVLEDEQPGNLEPDISLAILELEMTSDLGLAQIAEYQSSQGNWR